MHDSSYWNNRYLDQKTGWDIGHPSPAIIEFFIDKNNLSSILIPGCGNAYEGEFLFNQGFANLTLADFAAETKKNFLRRCGNFDPEKFVVGDFFELKGQFDYIIEQTFFCALTPHLREDYVIKMKELLHPDGKLVGLMFNADLNTEYPPYGGCQEEYLDLFSKHFSVVNLSNCDNSIVPRAGRELWIEIGH